MKLIVGLGNPGTKYVGTRHNLGFLVVDQFLKDFERVKNSNWSENSKLKSHLALLDVEPKGGKAEKVLLAKPQTFMNNSGMAVALLSQYYKIDPSDIWIIHDELDLPMGGMRIRLGGAAAGHHGVESIIEHLGTDKFWRYRLGIGVSKPHIKQNGDDEGVVKPPSKERIHDVEDYVLGSFASNEQGKSRELVKHGVKSLEHALEKGITAAMNKFNTR